MAVSTIALYAGPSSSVCSGQHQISSHASHDFDVNARSTSSSAASPSQKALIGGLSCLFASSPIKSANYASGAEELGSTWHDRVVDELGSSFRYSSLSSSLKRDQAHQSPVSVLQGINSSIGSSSRSPPMRISGDFCSTRSVTGGITIDFGSIRSGPGEICNGFVRNVLGSSVASPPLDLDVKDFDLPCGLSPCEHELTFNMEDSFVGTDLPPYARDFLSEAQSRHPIFRDDFIIKAFCEAERAHRGQMRSSGHPYLQHCVETAVLLANIGANSTVVAAGLLHDTVDDSFVTYDTISRSFGAEIADLVEGVSKLSQLSKLARENNTASKTVEADRLHTMFLAMADARAVLIKLADRLHNMSTLDALASFKQQRFAKETLEIFAPLANRLGISTWKEQLENLCFKYLNPDRHGELSSKLENFFDESAISSCLSKLERALKDGGIAYHGLLGRHKSLYSIYSKMLKKKLNMDEIHDIHGLRLIVETKEDCYKALDIVRQLWHEVPGRFKDYIVSPKFNGYQSLHTVVTGERMIPFEVQIRTKEMHLQAEYGIAAHWRYKEGDCIHPTFVLQMVEWARWVISWQCEATSKDPPALCFADSVKLPCTFPTHSKGCTFSCKPDCGPVFVVVIENDKMSVQEMPANSSVKDLLEKAGRGGSRGGFFSGPRLNHEPISDPARKLKMGDVVELTLALPDKSLIEYREEIQRMYDRGVKGASPSTVGSAAGSRSRHVFS